MKRNFIFTPEEQEIEDAINRGAYSLVSNLEEAKAEAVAAARNTIIKPAAVGSPGAAKTLSEMLKGITPENMHPAVDWGPEVGAEQWEYNPLD